MCGESGAERREKCSERANQRKWMTEHLEWPAQAVVIVVFDLHALEVGLKDSARGLLPGIGVDAMQSDYLPAQRAHRRCRPFLVKRL
jgi:hypothetical protein